MEELKKSIEDIMKNLKVVQSGREPLEIQYCKICEETVIMEYIGDMMKGYSKDEKKPYESMPLFNCNGCHGTFVYHERRNKEC